jgi:phosphotriesterase-related protein
MAIMTVSGPVAKEAIGVTLPHEHFFIDIRWACGTTTEAMREAMLNEPVTMRRLGVLRRDPMALKDNVLLSDPELMAAEALEFKKAGGKTIVDQSSIGTGRSPLAIRDLANLTGINVVMGCGFYLHGGLPAAITHDTEGNLVKMVLREIRSGVGDTGVRPGIIGEIGIRPSIEDWERTSLRVAAQAHRETGLPISVHVQAVPTIPGFTDEPNGLAVLDLLEKSGVRPDRVIISHTDARIHLAYMKAIMDRGAYAEFDHIGEEFYIDSADFRMDSDMDRVEAIAELIRGGYEKRILISQDVCFKTDLVAFGGWGYAHILNNIVPMMIRRGITRESIHTIMVGNPADILDVDGVSIQS